MLLLHGGDLPYAPVKNLPAYARLLTDGNITCVRFDKRSYQHAQTLQ
jgi:hypothetical protein